MYDSNLHSVIHTTSNLVDLACHLRAVDFNSNSSCFAAGGSDKNVYLFDGSTLDPISTFTNDHMHVENTGKIACIKSHPIDPNLFVVGSTSHAIYLYDVRANGSYACFKGPNLIGESISIHGDIIVTGSYRHKAEMELFSFSQQTQLDTFDFSHSDQLNHGQITSTNFTPDGQFIIAGGAGKNEVKIFHNDLQTSRKYPVQYQITDLPDCVTHISNNHNTVVVGLLNCNLISFTFKTLTDQDEPQVSLEQIVEMQRVKEEGLKKQRHNLSHNLGPFDPIYYNN